MVSEKMMIECAIGIHLRPAGALCEEAIKYKSLITFECENGKTANAKSVLSVLAAGVKCGDEIQIKCDGEDEQEALSSVVKVLKESLKD